MIQNTINNLISTGIKALGLPDTTISLDHSSDVSHGDYSSNIALVLLSQISPNQDYPNPRILADILVKQINSSIPKEISKIEVAGPGFINFFLSDAYYVDQLNQILSNKEAYGSNEDFQGKKAIVEFSSPNIAKPFTIGHLRSTIIGAAIANLLEFTGWQVFRDNHLGDWGTQFGKQIYAIMNFGGGENANIEKIASSENPVKELVKLYVEFHTKAEVDSSLNDKGREWFKKLEDGDGKARELWQKCIDWSWQEFQKIYNALGITFSPDFDSGRGLGEAFFEDKMSEPIETLKQKNLLHEGKEGAQLVFFPEETNLPPLMILKADGATLYSTRDLATDYYRLNNYHPDLIINEVGSEQTLYFRQLFYIEELLGWFKKDQRVHIGHGLYRFKDKKMSTRKGVVIWLEDVLSEAVNKAAQLKKDDTQASVAFEVGIGALKWNDLKRKPSLDIVFDWEEILNMEGNSGPYVQYAHARACSVLSKSGQMDFSLNSESIFSNDDERNLAKKITYFPTMVSNAAKDYAPYMVANYIFDVAQAYNSFYNKHSILGAGKIKVSTSQRNLRLSLTAATAQILKNGLNLLGISAPTEM